MKDQRSKTDKGDESGKTGLIPNEQITGSDADKAYNEEGEFHKPSSTREDSNEQKGSDADK